VEFSLHLPIADLHRKSGLSRHLSRFHFLTTTFAGIISITISCGLGTYAVAQQLPANANAFARDVLHHEVEAQTLDHVLWAYSERKGCDGKQELFHVFQTEQGSIERLVAVNGRSLSPAELQEEDRRIQKLISQPAEIRQRQKKQREDGEQARALLIMLPDAFLFQYDGKQGALVRLKFAPNPKFHPSDHAGQVFHHMTGTMLLDPQQKRLAAIDGVLTSEVKFFGGLLGHLNKGGTFKVEQKEVSPHLWEVTTMHVHMKGKVLFFKTVAVQEDQTYADFRSVPSDTTLAQAAELLKRVQDQPQAQARN
jgi:hypothetical protein